jgi:16S rRNA (uracil1498-N3)-methyltransferase
MKERDLIVPLAALSSTRKGAIVTVRGEDGEELRGRVVEAGEGVAKIRLFEELFFPSESPLHIILIQSLPKKEKMAFIIQKATELGVNAILPCITERSVTLDSAGFAQDKSHKWTAIAGKAVEQCRRRMVPPVLPCTSFTDAVNSFADDPGLKIILYERERLVRVRDIAVAQDVRTVVLACGPEGGFSEEEISWAEKAGFKALSLGGRILRAETASLAALAIIQHRWGDL